MGWNKWGEVGTETAFSYGHFCNNLLNTLRRCAKIIWTITERVNDYCNFLIK